MKRLTAVIVLALGITYSTAQQIPDKPNVIVIVSDDAGYADFGCYGGTEIPTPNIDALAKNGTLFTDAYVSASVCAPSRAGILTGMYQQRFGFEHNTSELPVAPFTQADVGIDTTIRTIGDQMQHNGYRTIAIGKWHQGDEEPYFPLNRGFDEFFGFVGGHRNFYGYKGQAPSRILAIYDNDKIIPESKVTYLTDMLTDRAISFVESNKDRPFFMYLAYNAVHTPMDAKPELLARFDHISDPGRRSYAAMMTSLDDNIGTLVATLKAQNIYDNTLIVFVNDNGAATNNSADNGNLRGLKGSKWQGGIKVAYIMQYPNVIPAGKRYHHMVSTLDIVPTAVGAAKGELIPGQLTDGVNLLPFIDGAIRKAPHKDLFWRRGIAAAVRSGKWKLIRSGDTNPVLLFNLENDPGETTNLANNHRFTVKKLLRKLEAWEKKVESPRWLSPYGDYNQIMKHRMEVIGREMERQYP